MNFRAVRAGGIPCGIDDRIRRFSHHRGQVCGSSWHKNQSSAENARRPCCSTVRGKNDRQDSESSNSISGAFPVSRSRTRRPESRNRECRKPSGTPSRSDRTQQKMQKEIPRQKNHEYIPPSDPLKFFITVQRLPIHHFRSIRLREMFRIFAPQSLSFQ